ncbi:MAG: hypothetical protein KAW89_01645 [Armatimonadetes bacterium]|nr:hypothetical protein [Armatimonadota bacterium]
MRNNLAIVCMALLVLGVTGLVTAAKPPPPPGPRDLHLDSTEVDFGSIQPGTQLTSEPLTGTVIFPGRAGRIAMLLPPDTEQICLVHEQYPGTTIPLAWQLRLFDGVGWSDWHPPEPGRLPGSGDNALLWDIPGLAPGLYEFELCASLEVPALQLAGHYHVNAEIELVAAYK